MEKESKKNGDRIHGGLLKTVSGMQLNNLLKCKKKKKDAFLL